MLWMHIVALLSETVLGGRGSSLMDSEQTRKCLTCSQFNLAHGHQACSNPGVCFAPVCYALITSEHHYLYLAGCLKGNVSFPFRKGEIDRRILCRTTSEFGICTCLGTPYGCNMDIYNRKISISDFYLINTSREDFDDILQTSLGFDSEFLKQRQRHMKLVRQPNTTFTGTFISPDSSPIQAPFFLLTGLIFGSIWLNK